MKNPLSIYIHWPFCKAKCPYCDFNSHVREGVDHARWRAALLRELEYYAKKLPDREVKSVFFGGGTPSLMQARTVAELVQATGRNWQVAKDVEITLEANPTSVEAGHFKEFRDAGVNRVSIGIQSLLPEALTFLGRQHSVSEAMAALALARETFGRFNFDLIYARPGQSLEAWEAELREALSLAGGHLSLYQLTIEENTAFYTSHRKGAFVMPQEELAADMYQRTQEIMQERGLPAYEISNHASVGQESRHNLAYWRADDVIGIGPGAHGRYNIKDENTSRRFATETIKSPERWLERVEQSGTGLIAEVELSLRERMEEAVMMGLRLRDGIDYADWQSRTGLDLRRALSQPKLKALSEQGFIDADEKHIKTTGAGRLLLNLITAQLLEQ